MYPLFSFSKYLVCVGDDSGSIKFFKFTKGTPTLKWTSSPYDHDISRVELTGKSFIRDKIFCTGGT